MMKYTIDHAISAIIHPADVKPTGVAIYAILFSQGKVLEHRWLPDGTLVEDPGTQLVLDVTVPHPRNPLKVVLPGNQLRAHPDHYGEIFRLDSGHLAVVFNHKRWPKAMG
jgi:hypothetical protein